MISRCILRFSLLFPFFFQVFHLKYKLLAHLEWVCHVISFSPGTFQVSVSKGIPMPTANPQFLSSMRMLEVLVPFIQSSASIFESHYQLQIPKEPVSVNCFQWRLSHWVTSKKKYVAIRIGTRTMLHNHTYNILIIMSCHMNLSTHF